MICNRIVVGLVVFQIAMIGILALRRAITRSVLVLPLLVATVWFSIVFQRRFRPLMKFIALRSIERDGDGTLNSAGLELPVPRFDTDTDRGRHVDEDSDTGLRYVNPSLTMPLEKAWVVKVGGASVNGSGDADGETV